MTKDSDGFIRDSDMRQILQLVDALDRSSLDTLQLDAGHFRLTLGKGAALAELPSAPAMLAPAAAPAPAASTPGAPVPVAAPAKAASAQSDVPGTIAVRAPIMGLFYAKPDPGSPPFVTVGAEVDEGSTVGLIEVMKVFNAVPAGARGVIAEICVENGAPVEIGQVLFRIRPSA